ncbi:MAG: hypothetical protein QM731_00235 [Chitinophagaceae bacterium]
MKKQTAIPEMAWIGTMRRRALTFYMLNGEYLVRSRSTLSAEKVKHAACFKNTMRSAGRLSKASSLAAAVYQQLPEGWKLHSLYRTMVGIAAVLLKTAEHTEEAITMALWQYLEEVGFRKDIEYEVVAPSTGQYEEGLMYKVQSLRSFRMGSLSKRSKLRRQRSRSSAGLYSLLVFLPLVSFTFKQFFVPDG